MGDSNNATMAVKNLSRFSGKDKHEFINFTDKVKAILSMPAPDIYNILMGEEKPASTGDETLTKWERNNTSSLHFKQHHTRLLHALPGHGRGSTRGGEALRMPVAQRAKDAETSRSLGKRWRNSTTPAATPLARYVTTVWTAQTPSGARNWASCCTTWKPPGVACTRWRSTSPTVSLAALSLLLFLRSTSCCGTPASEAANSRWRTSCVRRGKCALTPSPILRAHSLLRAARWPCMYNVTKAG